MIYQTHEGLQNVKKMKKAKEIDLTKWDQPKPKSNKQQSKRGISAQRPLLHQKEKGI